MQAFRTFKKRQGIFGNPLTLPSVGAEFAARVCCMEIPSSHVITLSHYYVHDVLGIFIHYVVAKDVVQTVAHNFTCSICPDAEYYIGPPIDIGDQCRQCSSSGRVLYLRGTILRAGILDRDDRARFDVVTVVIHTAIVWLGEEISNRPFTLELAATGRMSNLPA